MTTIDDFLEYLDGNGIVVTDMDLVYSALEDLWGEKGTITLTKYIP